MASAVLPKPSPDALPCPPLLETLTEIDEESFNLKVKPELKHDSANKPKPLRGKGPGGRRVRVKTACTNCKAAKARCDTGRPCSRCVKRGFPHKCIDAVPKRRGRKRSHDVYSRAKMLVERMEGGRTAQFGPPLGLTAHPAAFGTVATPATRMGAVGAGERVSAHRLSLKAQTMNNYLATLQSKNLVFANPVGPAGPNNTMTVEAKATPAQWDGLNWHHFAKVQHQRAQVHGQLLARAAAQVFPHLPPAAPIPKPMHISNPTQPLRNPNPSPVARVLNAAPRRGNLKTPNPNPTPVPPRTTREGQTGFRGGGGEERMIPGMPTQEPDCERFFTDDRSQYGESSPSNTHGQGRLDPRSRIKKKAHNLVSYLEQLRTGPNPPSADHRSYLKTDGKAMMMLEHPPSPLNYEVGFSFHGPPEDPHINQMPPRPVVAPSPAETFTQLLSTEESEPSSYFSENIFGEEWIDSSETRIHSLIRN